uniref:Secreted protein n=1 Tax=Panagrellus redivivus TaxID=6233 RepID=A0A7E4UPS3_PANRE
MPFPGVIRFRVVVSKHSSHDQMHQKQFLKHSQKEKSVPKDHHAGSLPSLLLCALTVSLQMRCSSNLDEFEHVTALFRAGITCGLIGVGLRPASERKGKRFEMDVSNLHATLL